MKYSFKYSSQFKRDLKRIKKQSLSNYKSLTTFLVLLENHGVDGIPPKHKPHPLKGNYKGTLEAHVKPDLLVVWFQFNDRMEIELVRCGSHSDLF